jgi:hypothetical protein
MVEELKMQIDSSLIEEERKASGLNKEQLSSDLVQALKELQSATCKDKGKINAAVFSIYRMQELLIYIKLCENLRNDWNIYVKKYLESWTELQKVFENKLSEVEKKMIDCSNARDRLLDCFNQLNSLKLSLLAKV